MTGAAVQNKDGYIYGVYIGNEAGETDVYDSANSLSLEFSKEHLDWIYSLINKNSNQNRDRTERNSSSVAENQGNKVLHNNTTKKPENAKHTDPRDWMGGGGFGNASSAPSRSSQPVNAGGASVSGGGNSTSHTTSIGNRSNYNEISKPDLRNHNTDNNTVNNTRPWRIENTIHNKSAKIIFKLLTEKYGLSGESASGWMAIMEYESLFHPYQTGIGADSNHYGLFMLNENKYKSSKYYKENATLEEEIENQIQFFIDNHVLSESSQIFLKENNIKDINLVDNSSGISTNILHKLLIKNNSDVNEDIIKVSGEINEFFNKDKIKADYNKLLKNKLIKEIKNSTESKPADKPSTTNTENKPVDKTSTTNTENKSEDKPYNTNTENKPADKPSTTNTETKPVDNPSTTKQTVRNKVIVKDKNNLTKEEINKINDKVKEIKAESFVINTTKDIKDLKLSDKDVVSSLINNNLEGKKVSEIEVKNELPKNEKGIIIAKVEENKETKTNKLVLETIPSKDLIIEEKENNKLLEKEREIDNIVEDVNNDKVKNLAAEKDELKVTRFLTKDGKEIKDAEVGETKDKEIKDKDGNIYELETAETKDGITTNVYKLKENKNTEKEEKPENKLEDKSQSVKSDKKADEDKISDIIDNVNKVDEKENKPSGDGTKILINEKEELKVTKFATKDGKEIKDAEVGETKDKEIKDKYGNVYELETTETKDGISTNIYKLKSEDKKVSSTEIEDKTISPVEINEKTKTENKSDLAETKKDKKSSNDSNLNKEKTNTNSKVNDSSNKNTSNNSSSSNSETTRQTPNTSVGNNNSVLLFGTSLMSAGLAGIALKRRKNN